MKFAQVCTFLLFAVWHDERGILKRHRSRTDLSVSNWLRVDIRDRRRLFIIHCLVYTYAAVARLIASGFCVFFQRTKRLEPEIEHTLTQLVHRNLPASHDANIFRHCVS